MGYQDLASSELRQAVSARALCHFADLYEETNLLLEKGSESCITIIASINRDHQKSPKLVPKSALSELRSWLQWFEVWLHHFERVKVVVPGRKLGRRG